MRAQWLHRFAPFLLIMFGNMVQATTAATTTPSRGDDIAQGDRIILNTDVPIFQLDPNAAEKDATMKSCAPWRSQIEIETAPTTTTTTSANLQSSGMAAPTKTTSTGTVTTTEASAPANDGVTTKTTTSTTATARIVRVGPSKLRRKIDSIFGIEGAPYEVPITDASGNKIMVPGCRQVPSGMNPTVLQGTTYTFKPSDLQGYSTERFGLTYGVVVVPNKVIIADRSFISSSSVLPYVGYEAWGPGVAGALVFAAGVGTAPSSAQASATTTTGQSTGTKATFSVATGMVGTIAGAFKVGLLVGVDTQGRNSGFKYQGKPWLGISLGAGTQ